ncbi:TorD/DmsD family molecular chaperone [Flexistipes sp.]|uniref:TorD/DmsD family molecular chaperone n=1 Tax=Flexistipes sp. TaxID=3088135 RepID=UPI002E1B5B15|nr:molecular chaperone TorD family protein [Flexistipes sp.]
MDNNDIILKSRDFFGSTTSEDLEQSYYDICEFYKIPCEKEINWEEEEFVFNRLFVGPAAPLAPMVASAYLDPEARIHGVTTTDVRTFYYELGLTLENEGKEPEDSLLHELSICSYLSQTAKIKPECRDIYNKFLKFHFFLWVPEFISRALNNAGDSVAVSKVLNLFSDWIIRETNKLLEGVL